MKAWIEQEMATAEMGDSRLVKRMKLMLERMTDSPMVSVKSAFKGWAEVMAAYRFFDNPRASLEAVIGPHREATLRRVKEHKRVLHIQDTTELDYSLKKHLRGAGPLNDPSRTGFFAHNQLVISSERLVLGVWKTEIWARDDAGLGRSAERKHLPIEKKESYRWLQGYRDACCLADLAPQTEVIACADREADIYELFAEWHQRSAQGLKPAEWLIRCNENRRLSKRGPENPEQKVNTFETIREELQCSALLGILTIHIKAKEQWKKINGNRRKVSRSARKAALEVRAATVTLRAPHRKHTELPEVSIQVVMATEKDPPTDEEPIEWVLLTSLAVNDFAGAAEIVQLYTGRWEIEVFHRVLKTGCKVEELQLKTDKRALVAIALYMVVAWRVLYVMKLGRECPELPCDVVFEEEEWQSVWVICYGVEGLKSKPSLGKFITKVAEFGGFLARTADGFPGAQAVWQGMTRMRDFALAWHVYRQTQSQLHRGPTCV